CVVNDASEADYVTDVLDRYAKLDHRIKVVHLAENSHISAATNAALEMATGDWVAFMDHDDLLPQHALALVAEAIVNAAERGDDLGLLYSDEDKIDHTRERHSPYFKPEFDRLLLLGQNYLTHFLVVRRDLVAAAGGMRIGFEGSQDWDLALRVTERLEDSQVVHIPHVLYHWRSHHDSTAAALSAKPYAADAGRRAVAEHLARVCRPAQVSTLPSGHNRVTWPLPEAPPLVSVVIPTRDGVYLRRCLDSLLERTEYPSLEVTVVDNGSTDPEVLAYLAGRNDVTVLRDERPFNYSTLNNEAVEQATGEVVCLLNDDTEVISGSWLTEMVSQLLQPRVGAVGAKLYYDDGTIQHAGVVLGVGGVAGHLYRRAAGDSHGQMGRLRLAQNLSAVTAACMVTRRRLWEQLGGLESVHLAVAFNDVDFCLRLRQAGWQVVWTPAAELIHHESVSRGTEKKRRSAFAAEERYIQERWGPALRRDPAYSPNLSLVVENGSLAWPPRVSYR
ncbi:MAG TPA: glycosyltransferase family 2 protein, partial [Acidimicrobiales bacterium]|nr:glycosyltransferase family 2 protein [Acidimicrobiales bacterium]